MLEKFWARERTNRYNESSNSRGEDFRALLDALSLARALYTQICNARDPKGAHDQRKCAMIDDALKLASAAAGASVKRTAT